MVKKETPGGRERYEHIRIEMEYAVPLIRHLQKELGVDAVNNALKSWTREKTELAESQEAPRGELGETKVVFQAHADFGLDIEVIEDTDEKYGVNVTRCRFMEMMEGLNARDLGPNLLCNHDFSGALEEGLKLDRTQTIMRGYDHCNFRYTRR